MGVIGTYCQACGVATQHDHYVPAAEGGRLKIFRASQPDGGHRWEPGEFPFRFGPEHAWMTSAVVAQDGQVSAGTVEDGELTTSDGESIFVAEGTEEGLTYHAACWELLGQRPLRTEGTHRWSFIHPYQQQLFEVRALQDEGLGWMLEDPRTSGRSRAWREALFRDGWELHPPATGWVGNARYDADRVRSSVSRWRPALSTTTALDTRWTSLIRLELSYPEAQDAVGRLLEWEVALAARVQGDEELCLLSSEVTRTGATVQLLQARGTGLHLITSALPDASVATTQVVELLRGEWPTRLAPLLR